MKGQTGNPKTWPQFSLEMVEGKLPVVETQLVEKNARGPLLLVGGLEPSHLNLRLDYLKFSRRKFIRKCESSTKSLKIH